MEQGVGVGEGAKKAQRMLRLTGHRLPITDHSSRLT
jgi:hypothetical protein